MVNCRLNETDSQLFASVTSVDLLVTLFCRAGPGGAGFSRMMLPDMMICLEGRERRLTTMDDSSRTRPT